MSEKSKNIIKHLSDDVIVDWTSYFLWFCWPEHGISAGEVTKVIYSVTKEYLKACSQGLPYHFPDAEALVLKFDFEPNQIEQNGNGGCCL